MRLNHSLMVFNVYLCLFYPAVDLTAQPIRPFADALAGTCGDGDNSDVGVETGDVSFAGLKVKVKIRHHVDLVYQQAVAY